MKWRIILDEVSAKHRVPVEAIKGCCRRKATIAARWEVWARIRTETRFSLRQIARLTGGFDHRAVNKACKKMGVA